MADNFMAACGQAAEALLLFQNITRQDVQRVAESATLASTNADSHTNIRSELSRRFPSYRPAGLLPTASSSSDDVPNNGRQPSSGKKRGQRSRTSSKTTSKACSTKRGRPAASNIVYRDLVIVPDPATKKVPTHSARVALEKNKLIVSGFPFDRSWDATSLKSNIRKQLPHQDMLFQYVKACYGTLVEPKFANGCDITTDALLKISGQGAVYVRLLDKHNIESETESSSDEELLQTTLSFSRDDTTNNRDQELMGNNVTGHKVVSPFEGTDFCCFELILQY